MSTADKKITDNALDILAFQIQKIQEFYAQIESIVNEHTWAREDGDVEAVAEIENDLVNNFNDLDEMDKSLRSHIEKILDGSVTETSSLAAAKASGVMEAVTEKKPLPPTSPRAQPRPAPASSVAGAPVAKPSRLAPARLGGK